METEEEVRGFCFFLKIERSDLHQLAVDSLFERPHCLVICLYEINVRKEEEEKGEERDRAVACEFLNSRREAESRGEDRIQYTHCQVVTKNLDDFPNVHTR